MALRVRLCRRDEVVAGAMRSFQVAGVTWPVLATELDGTVVAVAGVCPHEDVGLADGDLEDGCLTCPGHAYQFDLRTGACLHDRLLELRRYPVSLDVHGDVWVDLL